MFNNFSSSCLDSYPNNIEIIDLNYKNLKEFPDLSRFTNLKELYIKKNNLIRIPKLPDTLKIFDCSWNNTITYIHSIPPNLYSLNCHGNNISQLPELPSSLTYLNISCNNFSILPKLPNHLINLFCTNNKLTILPTLPNTLKSFDCSYNEIIQLPICPSELYLLCCHNNQLTEIPNSYSNITLLYCSNNNIINITSFNKLVAITFEKNIFYSIFDLSTIEQDSYIKNTCRTTRFVNIINSINKFKYTFYCLKYKSQFIKLLWSMREKKAMKEYHPNNLIKLLDNILEEDIDDIIDKW